MECYVGNFERSSSTQKRENEELMKIRSKTKGVNPCFLTIFGPFWNFRGKVKIWKSQRNFGFLHWSSWFKTKICGNYLGEKINQKVKGLTHGFLTTKELESPQKYAIPPAFSCFDFWSNFLPKNCTQVLHKLAWMNAEFRYFASVYVFSSYLEMFRVAQIVQNHEWTLSLFVQIFDYKKFTPVFTQHDQSQCKITLFRQHFTIFTWYRNFEKGPKIVKIDRFIPLLFGQNFRPQKRNSQGLHKTNKSVQTYFISPALPHFHSILKVS